MTLLEAAQEGRITALMRAVAEAEHIPPEALRDRVAAGRVVIPANRRRVPARPCGIGAGLTVKVNANLGTSHDYADSDAEMAKLDAAIAAGADTVMDLSTGGDIRAIRRRVLERSPVPVGTVPIYEALVTAARSGKEGVKGLTDDDILDCVRRHCEDGVDFVTLHCGVTRRIVEEVRRTPRHCGIVSRGGAFLAAWIALHDRENPLLERFDEVLDILRRHDVTISLGDGLRPGALADSFDRPQMEELRVLSGLVQRAREAGVQAMVEGPGHVPLHHVEAQVRIQKALCDEAPFYVLGPIVTDVAAGYDHIAAAIGGAVAAAAGADFLCYVTPTEHLGLPNATHVREGVIAARIAAHAADIARRAPAAEAWDRDLSHLRRERRWEELLSRCMDPERAHALRSARRSGDEHVCSMCGEYCAFKLLDDIGLKAE